MMCNVGNHGNCSLFTTSQDTSPGCSWKHMARFSSMSWPGMCQISMENSLKPLHFRATNYVPRQKKQYGFIWFSYGVSINGGRIFHCKPSILGYPHLWKPLFLCSNTCILAYNFIHSYTHWPWAVGAQLTACAASRT